MIYNQVTAYRKLICKFLMIFLTNSSIDVQNKLFNLLQNNETNHTPGEVVILNHSSHEEVKTENKGFENKYLKMNSKRASV